jgi:hypothetical protein
MSSLVCIAGGGFLAAVLWFDLMFDVQALGSAPSSAAIGSIMAYYRRVTTDASPMGHLVAAVMVATLVASVRDLTRAQSRRALRGVALLLAAAPIALALLRVVPNAVALGLAPAAGPEQVALAQSILRDHILCLVSILGFLAVRFRLALRPWAGDHG